MNALFKIINPHNPTVIKDCGGRDNLTVTNDVERVVRELLDTVLVSGDTLFYYDSYGEIDEIIFSNAGFICFAPGCIEDRVDEINKKSGRIAAEEFCAKLGLPLQRCEPCDNDEPVYKRNCLICGTAVK